MTTLFHAVDLICAKRDGSELSPEAVRWFVNAAATGAIPDEQTAAMLMAVLFRGLSAAELSAWTSAMVDSGKRLDLSGVARPTVDKHSTGGVGDKVSLVLAPLLAACGAAVPQLSGRGLGHTGGTLDKLEAIEGWRSSLSDEEIKYQLAEVGAVICAAVGDLAPADHKLYALRDITGTVESIPLVASSIMSKKIAEGTDALVLDVKVGSGAFMKKREQARSLARTMVALGADHGLRTSALLTGMDIPLGRAAGNALEVAEAMETLAGGGPADLLEVTLALAQEMLRLAGLDADPAEVLASGRAMDAWRKMVAAQGGNLSVPLPKAKVREPLNTPDGGQLVRLDAYAVGIAAWRLGAGRARQEDPVDPSAGVICLLKPGETVRAGQPLLELHTSDPSLLPGALAALEGGFDIVEPGAKRSQIPRRDPDDAEEGCDAGVRREDSSPPALGSTSELILERITGNE